MTVSRTQQIKHISIPDKIKMSVCKQRLPKTQVKKKKEKKINGTVPQICTHNIYRMYMLVLNRLFFFFPPVLVIIKCANLQQSILLY